MNPNDKFISNVNYTPSGTPLEEKRMNDYKEFLRESKIKKEEEERRRREKTEGEGSYMEEIIDYIYEKD